jgi:hypothetical protein
LEKGVTGKKNVIMLKMFRVALFIFNASVENHLLKEILNSDLNWINCKQIVISQYVSTVFRTQTIIRTQF